MSLVAKLILVTLIATSLTACKDSNTVRLLKLPKDYVCSEEQMVLMKREYDICTQTGYLDSVCYAIAKSTNCSKIDRKDK